MAIDNLNFYSTGLPAGQQTDKYSSQPGCLKSKNLDIFSSSKSVKATAWSSPSQADADIIKQEGNLKLKTDGKVYEEILGVDTLVVDPSINFPVYEVCYDGRYGTYENAERGTPTDMVVKSDENGWQSFVVFTDTASYTYSKTPYILDKQLGEISSNLTASAGNRYTFEKNSNSGSSSHVEIKIPKGYMGKIPIHIEALQYQDSETDISIDAINRRVCKYYYDAQLDTMLPTYKAVISETVPSGDITSNDGVTFYVDCSPRDEDFWIDIIFKYTRHEGVSTYGWHGTLRIDLNNYGNLYRVPGTTGDFNEFYSYLPVQTRHLSPVGEYYWMKGSTFQPLYSWEYERVNTSTGNKVPRYDFVAEYGWENNVSMDIVNIISWNDSFYMIGNMNGNGYIIPCDLSGSRGTPYIAYGCEFTGAVNIDYLLYLVGTDRGVSTFWVYNSQQLVPILMGREEESSKNLIDSYEQYRFSGKMVEYRGDLVMATTDNRIFAYGQTYGGKGGAFIHEVPGTVDALKANGRDLIVDYTSNGVKYSITLQDNTPIKKYNLEWEAEYPIAIGNHLLEKEETDLYASFILPNSSCKLEFWGMANHYHFRTFKSSDSYTFLESADYKMKGCTGNYKLKFIEKNDNYYTFRLEGELPVQNGTQMKITDTEGTELITYSEYNHFRKIGEITTDKYLEGEFRFTNLNNKLELPKSHSLQVMVRGKGNQNYTPELFTLDLVANQRDRG